MACIGAPAGVAASAVPKVPVIQVTQPMTPPVSPGKLLGTRIYGRGHHDDTSSSRKGAAMRARAGDTLLVSGSHTRTGRLSEVVGPNGSPPYVVKWLADGHIAMVTPDEYSRIVPASDGLVSGE